MDDTMPSVQIQLNISPDEFLNWYKGLAKSVVTRAVDGRVVEFPASVLQRFVSPEGVRGTFLLTFDGNNRFVQMERLNPSTNGNLDTYG